MIKWAIFLIIILLTIYAPTELTRNIVVDYSHWDSASRPLAVYSKLYVGEICFVWIGYVVSMALIGKLIYSKID